MARSKWSGKGHIQTQTIREYPTWRGRETQQIAFKTGVVCLIVGFLLGAACSGNIDLDKIKVPDPNPTVQPTKSREDRKGKDNNVWTPE